MSSRRTDRVSAPGKLVLCGEYAVVDGRPAVVAAVDLRAVAEVTEGVESTEGAHVLRVRGNGPRWTVVRPDDLRHPAVNDVDQEQPLLAAVLRELVHRGFPLPAASIEVSTADFSTKAGKFGLGSSAAAAVAFTAALLPERSVDELHDVARTAHRAFQGGGSGIDVAASAYGGLLVFADGHVVQAPPLPPSLHVAVVWTGVSARTQGFVDAWRALAHREDHLSRIVAATEHFLEAARTNNARALLDAVHEAREAMARMGEAARIDVVSEEHHRIAQIAASVGSAAKPSGAGGGDVAVCFVDHADRAELESRLESAGFSVVPVAIGSRGVGADP